MKGDRNLKLKLASTFDLSVVLSDYTAGSQTIPNHRGAGTGATHAANALTLPSSNPVPFYTLGFLTSQNSEKGNGLAEENQKSK